MDKVERLALGAGAVGLVVAAEAARCNDVIGSGVDSSNSEAIHGILHFPENSLKACFCIEEQRLLHDYCSGQGIFEERCVKLIVGYDQSS